MIDQEIFVIVRKKHKFLLKYVIELLLYNIFKKKKEGLKMEGPLPTL